MFQSTPVSGRNNLGEATPIPNHIIPLKGANRSQFLMNEERMTELEIKLGLIDNALDELNRTVFRQQTEIDLLQAQLRHLYGQMKAQAEAAEAAQPFSLRDEIPPHY